MRNKSPVTFYILADKESSFVHSDFEHSQKVFIKVLTITYEFLRNWKQENWKLIKSTPFVSLCMLYIKLYQVNKVIPISIQI